MVKTTTATTSKVTLLLLLALCLGYSSTLYAMQHDVDDEKEPKDIQAANSTSDHAKGNNRNNQPDKPIIPPPNSQALDKEDSEDPMPTGNATQQVDWRCKSIAFCKALTKVIACLESWQAINDDMDQLEKLMQDKSSLNNYKGILGAYHHVLDKHLNGKNNKKAFKFINDKIKELIECDYENCKGYDRNQRDQENELIQEVTMQQYGVEFIFIRDILDTIHAYLVHGSDSGHLYVTEDKPSKGDKESQKASDDEQKDEEDTPYTLVDQKMEALKKWQGGKKKNRSLLKTKFNTPLAEVAHSDNITSLTLLADHLKNNPSFTHWLQYMHDNHCDTDCLLAEIEMNAQEPFLSTDKALFASIKKYVQQQSAKKKQADHKKTASYGFGVRLYYWEQYRNNTHIDSDYNPGHRYCDLYVSPTYPSFKDEILAKGVAPNKWNQKIYAAKLMLSESCTLRMLKAAGLYADYGIKKGDSLSVWHMLSIVFYTNFTSLCTKFGGSFRYLSSAERVQDVVKRNAKWHHWAKYLREVVECFGTRIDGKVYDPEEGTIKQIKNIKGDTYYHGVSYLLFTKFSVNWYGPLSTSKQLAVATLFTNSTSNGLILNLKQDNEHLCFFNVCLLSCFGAEDERLFIGGYHPIQIASIRLLRDNLNIEQIMHALFMVNSIIRGKEPGHNNKALPVDGVIFSNLHASPTTFPLYAQEIWDKFRNQQQCIKIDMYYMYNYYKMFIPQLSKPQHKNLLLFEKIAKIFPNATEIICKRTDYDGDKGGYFSTIVDHKFIEGLKYALHKIDKQAKLQKIIIQTRAHKVKDAHNLYMKLFDALDWQIGKGSHTIVITKESYDVMYTEVTAKISAMIQSEKSSYEVTSLDAHILAELIANKNVPPAVLQKWKKFTNGFQRVTINIRHMYMYYALFAQHLSDPKRKNLLLFDQIAKLFPNVTEIICENTDWDQEKQNEWGRGSYSSAIVSTDFVAGLKARFQKMPKHTKLQKVMLITSQYEVTDDFNIYATHFEDLGWQIKKNNPIVLTKRPYLVDNQLQQITQSFNDEYDEEKVDPSKIDKAKQQENVLLEETSHFVEEMKKQLAKTPVPGYLERPEWDANAAPTFVADVLRMCRKQQYPQALAEAESHGIPTTLVPFIKRYIGKHPQLQQVAQKPDFCKAHLERRLSQEEVQSPNNAHDEEKVDSPKDQKKPKSPKVDKAKKQELALIQETCHFVEAMKRQLAKTPVPADLESATWDTNAATTFVAAILHMCRKQEYPHALSQAKNHGIPTALVPFIKTYMSHHPQLQQVAQRLAFCKSHLEKPLILGQIEQLRSQSSQYEDMEDENPDDEVFDLD